MHAHMHACIALHCIPSHSIPQEQPLVSSDFKQTDYSNSVDAALTMAYTPQ